MRKFEFAYGHGKKAFEFDENDLIKIIRMKEFPPLKDIKSCVLEAIRHPIG